MSPVKKYRVKKDVPFQFLQTERLKEGMIGTSASHLMGEVYYFKAEIGEDIALSPDVVERWNEYFELITDDGKA